ncbi:MAG: repair protein RecO [Bacteroidota bacterium]|jgi:DNA repair protein RecO (recombination protein O)
MLTKTKGIVFRFTKYGDSSVIATLFTEHAGVQSYILKGIRKSKSGSGMALYQPLTLLDLVVYHKDGATMHHIREAKCRHIYKNIPGNVLRETLAFFITEVMNKSIREQTHPEELFQFLEHSLILLDSSDEPLHDFHLRFMIGLSRFLGFGAQQSQEVVGGRILPNEVQENLQKLLDGKKTNMSYLHRKEILELLTGFYRDHIENFGTLKSVEVLQEILTQKH